MTSCESGEGLNEPGQAKTIEQLQRTPLGSEMALINFCLKLYKYANF